LQLAQFSLDHSADEVLWIGEDKRFLYVNNAACRFLGYTREELLTMTIADINPVFPMDAWENHWQNIKQQGFISLETNHQRKDGTIFPVEVTSTHLECGSQQYVCSFVRDITERKRTEDILRKWADIFQNIKMGVVVSDMGSGTLDTMNSAFASMYGYTVEELTGQPISAIYAPESQETFERSVRQVQEQDHVVFEAHHQRKDGSTFPVLVDVTVIRDRPDQIPYRIASVQDLTERKRAETQLLDQHKALTMLRERERLARELHDNLGQVLGYIKTQAQASRELLGRGEISRADGYLTQMIAASQENQTDIREFILGTTVPGTLEQGFFATLEHYLQRFEQIYGIAVSLEIAPDLIDHAFAPATDVQLLRIIQEALTNSRKHAHTQAVRVTFDMTAEHIRVVVADDGCGFDPQQPPTLADDGQHFGLRSMRERTAEIGGCLRLETRPGVGTQVIVQLPRHISRTSLSTSQRVLLVDDHPLFLQGIQNLLVGRGIEVVGTASDGREALVQARALQPDLILMDVEMPNCNGLEATRLIKAEMPDIQIVMLTMSENDAHLFEAIKGGASGYLLKGLDTDQFFVLLTNVLAGEMVISPGLASRILAEFASQHDGCDQSSTSVLPVSAPASHGVSPPPEASTAPPVELTERQMEVLSMVARGYTYREIGEMLHLSKHTIRYHMREVVSQLHLKNRAEIIAFVQQRGLLRSSPSV
jgi:PAS domain S-box-containing protein